MKIRADELVDGVIRFAVAPQGDFSFNHFLLMDRHPLFLHTGRVGWFEPLQELGRHHLQFLETPHFPHNWDACQFYDPDRKILFCSDVAATVGFESVATDNDISPAAVEFNKKVGYLSGGPHLRAGVDRLLKMNIELLAIQHGPSIRGAENVRKTLAALKLNFG